MTRSESFFHIGQCNTPDAEHPEWQRYVADSVIFGLVNNGSAHISRYDVEWYGQRYQLSNEFFWMARSVMEELAVKHNNEKTLRSLYRVPRERFVATWKLRLAPASPVALNIRDFVTGLVIDTFQHRTEFNKERPEVQICNWDAGWWQLKELWKVVAKEKLKELVLMRNELSASIRSRMRILGWLRPRNE